MSPSPPRKSLPLRFVVPTQPLVYPVPQTDPPRIRPRSYKQPRPRHLPRTKFDLSTKPRSNLSWKPRCYCKKLKLLQSLSKICRLTESVRTDRGRGLGLWVFRHLVRKKPPPPCHLGRYFLCLICRGQKVARVSAAPLPLPQESFQSYPTVRTTTLTPSPNHQQTSIPSVTIHKLRDSYVAACPVCTGTEVPFSDTSSFLYSSLPLRSPTTLLHF